jgi:chromosome partitioning protein
LRILAVVSQKGGSGKTTTAVSLAGALASKRRRVLLVDLDPQASASTWFQVTETGRGLLDAFTNGRLLLDLVRPSTTDAVSLIPACSWLTGLDKLLASEVGAETLLRRRLDVLPPKMWDYVLIDTPPTLGILAVNALAAAREVLVPVEAHVLPLNGLVQILGTIDVVRERLNPELTLSGILACRVTHTRHSKDVVASLRERFGTRVFETVIRENVRLAECPSFGVPITSYAADSPGAQDYLALADEVMAQESGPVERGEAGS